MKWAKNKGIIGQLVINCPSFKIDSRSKRIDGIDTVIELSLIRELLTKKNLSPKAT